MRSLSSDWGVPPDRVDEVRQALVETGGAVNVRGRDSEDHSLVIVAVTWLRDDVGVEAQAEVTSLAEQAIRDLGITHYRHASFGVGGEFHPDAQWVDVIHKPTGQLLGLKVLAHDAESADAEAKETAGAFGLPADEVTAYWTAT